MHRHTSLCGRLQLELLDREQRATERRIKAAKFPVLKSLETFEFRSIPSLNKSLVLELVRSEYLDRRENVLALGNSGTLLPVSKPIGKPSRSHGRGERRLSLRKALTQPCSSTSARSNGTTSFSTVSTFLIAPSSAKKRALMLYFNTNMGVTLIR